MDDWWSGAVKLPFASQDGGSYTGGPYRGVIHTTEVKSYTPSTKTYYGHHNPPHFTLAMQTTKGVSEPQIYQHFPISRAARALENHGGGVETNRRSAIQIEVAWKAAEIADLPMAMVQRLWDWMGWVQQQTGVKYTAPKFHGPEAAGITGAGRMTNDVWDAFNGWCGHQHVPENAHWDPGKLDISRLFTVKRPGSPLNCQVADWF